MSDGVKTREELYALAYETDVEDLSLTDLHRAIKHLQHRQRAVARLHHRAIRIRILKRARERRIRDIADRRKP